MKQSTSSTLLVYVGVIVLMVASGVWMLPNAMRASTELANKQADVVVYQSQVNALKQAQQQLVNAGRSGGIPINEAALDETIPPHRDYEDLLAMIESIGATSGITEPISISYTPVKEGAAAAIAETPVTLAAHGSYGAIEQLLRNLQTSLRPLALKAVDLSPSEEGGVTASISAITYTREQTSASIEEVVEETPGLVDPLTNTTNL